MTEEQKETAIVEWALPEPDAFRRQLQAIRLFQAIAKTEMVQGHDYGVIPGTSKPTLLKPGAEKIAKILRLADSYEILDRQEKWEEPFFRYLIRCSLNSIATGQLVSQGMGECNSMEAKYRWRWVWPNEVPEHVDKASLPIRTTKRGTKQYRLENEDIYSLVNTVLKMAKKRALVDAALSAGRLSDVFTQDIEDIVTEPESMAQEVHDGGAPKTSEPSQPSPVSVSPTTRGAPSANPPSAFLAGVTVPQQRQISAYLNQANVSEEKAEEYLGCPLGEWLKDKTLNEAIALIGTKRLS